MNDRELLELAAKAAGIVTHWGDSWQSDKMFRSIHRPHSHLVTNVEWNPLTDDGDALRLAVKLEIQAGYTEFSGEGVALWNRGNCQAREYGPEDRNAATRRAIVRAAAEIGKGIVAQPNGKNLPEDNYYKTQAEAFYGDKR